MQLQLSTQQSDTEYLLATLRAKQGEYVGDLYRLNIMVHSRAADLRKQGYKVECRRFGRKDYRYRLMVDPPTSAGAALTMSAHAGR